MNRMLNLLSRHIAAAVISIQVAAAQPVPLGKEHAHTGSPIRRYLLIASSSSFSLQIMSMM